VKFLGSSTSVHVGSDNEGVSGDEDMGVLDHGARSSGRVRGVDFNVQGRGVTESLNWHEFIGLL